MICCVMLFESSGSLTGYHGETRPAFLRLAEISFFSMGQLNKLPNASFVGMTGNLSITDTMDDLSGKRSFLPK